VHSFGDLPSKKMKKVNVCLGGQKISMLNKTQNKGREPAGIYSKSRFFFNSFLYEPKAIWDTSRNWGEEKANKLFFSQSQRKNAPWRTRPSAIRYGKLTFPSNES
jgi:hypothetical protein